MATVSWDIGDVWEVKNFKNFEFVGKKFEN